MKHVRRSMKYVMFAKKHECCTQFMPVVFSNCVMHSDIVTNMQGAEAVSAGFVRFVDGSKVVETYGSADSLLLQSKEKDAVYIRNMFVGLTDTNFYLKYEFAD